MPSQFIGQVIAFKSIETNIQRSVSRGGRMLVSGTPGHRYTFEIETPPLNVDELRELMAFMDDVGYGNPFTVTMPIFSDTRGAAGGSPVVSSAVAAGSKVIPISGFPVNQSSVLKSMDPLTFANHTKLYFVAPNYAGSSINTAGYSSDGTGAVSIRVTKPVVKAIPQGTAIDLSQPSMTVIADKDEWEAEIDAKNGKWTSLKLPVIEYF